MKQKRIRFYLLLNFGRADKYVADPEQAEAIRIISGQEELDKHGKKRRITLSPNVMEGLRQLGFEFTCVIGPGSRKEMRYAD